MNKSTKNFNLLLYPDDFSHMNCLRYLKSHNQLFKFVYILHDKDSELVESEVTSTTEIVSRETIAKTQLKKAHYHLTIVFPDRRTKSSVSKFLGLSENYVQECSSLVSSILYMIHDTPDSMNKFQYPLDELKGDNSLKALAATSSPTALYFNLLYQIVSSCSSYDEAITSILSHTEISEQLLSCFARFQLTFTTILNKNIAIISK